MAEPDFTLTSARFKDASVYVRVEAQGRNVVVLVLDGDGKRELLVAPHPTRFGRVALYDMTAWRGGRPVVPPSPGEAV